MSLIQEFGLWLRPRLYFIGCIFLLVFWLDLVRNCLFDISCVADLILLELLQLGVSSQVTSTDLALVVLWGGIFAPPLLIRISRMIHQQLRLSASQQTHSHSLRWGLHVASQGSNVFPTPLPLLFLPHNRPADAFASTGALFRKDHLGIFRFGNLRTLACDWLLWPHDNLGRNCSCVLSPSVSLEGSWGVFGGLGRPLSFNITGKQRNGEKLNA